MKTKQSLLALVVLVLAVLACQSPIPATVQPTVEVQAVPTIVPSTSDTSVLNPSAQQDSLVALYDNVSAGTVAILTDLGSGSGFVYDGKGRTSM